MRFAPDWHSDTAHLSASEPPPAREMFARWVTDLLERGETEAALDRAQSGTRDFPDYSTGWYVRSRAELACRHFEAARLSAERCLALEPDFFSAWLLLEKTEIQLGRNAAARSARCRFEELTGTSAASSQTAETPQPAPRAATSAPPQTATRSSLILVRPGPPGTFETPTLAEVYRRQGLLDRALGVYRRILERHPADLGAQAMVQKLEDELAARHRPLEKV
jgi:tetratricopeptide (TPR) repeat protein